MRNWISFFNFPIPKVLLQLILLLANDKAAFAWGQTGHRAIGLIAESYLNPKTKKKLKSLLAGEQLAMAGTWMDEVRSNRKYDYMTDWHWVTIPDNETYQQAEKNSHGDIIEAISRIVRELKSKQLSSNEELEKIKILIHLVGDIHQPLHVGTGLDRGGNDVKVKWFGAASNLHRVWDSDMIDNTQLSYTELVTTLTKPGKATIVKWQKSTVNDWAMESMGLRQQVYDIGDGNLSYEYVYKNIDTVRNRLLASGVRLAGLLNEIYR